MNKIDINFLLNLDAKETTSQINFQMKAMHDLFLKNILESMDEREQNESLNKIEIVSKRHNIPIENQPSEYEKILTPDIVLFRRDKLIVADIAISVNKESKSLEKLSKYNFFKLAFQSDDIDVEVSTFVAEPNMTSLLSVYHGNKYKSRDTIDFLTDFETIVTERGLIQELIERHPLREEIKSLMTDKELKPKKLEDIKLKNDNRILASKVVDRCFESEYDCLCFLNDRAGFKGLEERMTKEDELYIEALANHLEESFEKKKTQLKEEEISSSEKITNSVNKFIENSINDFSEGSTSEAPKFSKIVPVPYLERCFDDDELSRDERTLKTMSAINLYFQNTNTKGTIIDIINEALESVKIKEAKTIFLGKLDISADETLSDQKKRIIKKVKEMTGDRKSYVKDRRTIKVIRSENNKELFRDIIEVSGSNVYKLGKKESESKNKENKKYKLDTVDKNVDDLKKWFSRRSSAVPINNYLNNKKQEKNYRICEQQLNVCEEIAAQLALSLSEENSWKISRFYEELFTEVIHMFESNTKSEEFSFSSLGSNSTLLISQGGPRISTKNGVRNFWILSRLSNEDSFPFNSSCKYSILLDNMGNRWYCSKSLQFSSPELTHYATSAKFYLDVVPTTMSDIGTYNTEDLIEEDREYHFFYQMCLWFSNNKQASTIIQNTRYIAMSLISTFSKGELMIEKLNEPYRNTLTVHLVNNILKNITNFSEKIYIEAQKISDISDIETGADDVITSKFLAPRLIGRGTHKNFQEFVNEMYISNTIEKKRKDSYHELVKCFQKLMETVTKYNNIHKNKKTRNYLFGYDKKKSDFNFAIDLLDDETVSHSCFSGRFVNIGAKLACEELIENKKNVTDKLVFGKLGEEIEQLATSKAIVKERTDKVSWELLKKQREIKTKKRLKQKGKSFISQTLPKRLEKEYNFIDEKINEREFISDIRAKAQEIILELLHDDVGTQKSLLMRVLKAIESEDDMYFQIFPKDQYGGAREISIQDLTSRLNSFFLERVSESINHELSTEMLTKKDKFIKQGNIVREVSLGNLKNNLSTLFGNEDHTRWGPTMLPNQFGWLIKGFKPIIPYDYIKICCRIALKFSHKKIEIPKALYRKWDKKFIPDPNDDMFEISSEFKKTGKITFTNYNNMGQGILHETSSLLSVSRSKLTERLLNIMRPNKYIIRTQVGSDDKFNGIMVKASSKKEFVSLILLFLFIDRSTGKLFNIKKSDAKSELSPIAAEFNSNFIFDSCCTTPLFKFYRACCQVPRSLSYYDDARSVYSSINQCYQVGASGLSLYLLQLSGKRFIDTMYNMKRGGKNDLEKLGLDRSLTPIELGGFPYLCPFELTQSPVTTHLLKCMEIGSDKIKNCINYLCSKEARLKHDIRESEEDLPDLERANLLTPLFKIRLTSRLKSVQDKLKNLNLNKNLVKTYIEDNPFLVYTSPKDSKELMMKLAAKIYSQKSSSTYATENDAANFIRMSKMSSSKICSIDSEDEIDFNDRIKNKTFLECIDILIKESEEIIVEEPLFLKDIIIRNNTQALEIMEFSKSNVLLEGADENLIESEYNFKTKYKKIALANTTLGMKNNPVEILLNLWYPEKIKQYKIEMRYPSKIRSDTNRLLTTIDFLKNTPEQTLLGLDKNPSKENINSFIGSLCKILARELPKTAILNTRLPNKIKDRDYYKAEAEMNFIIGKKFFSKRTIDASNSIVTLKKGYEFMKTISSLGIRENSLLLISSAVSYFTTFSGKMIGERNDEENFILKNMQSVLNYNITGGAKFSEILLGLDHNLLKSSEIDNRAKKNLILARSLCFEDGIDWLNEYKNSTSNMSYYYVTQQPRLANGSFDTSEDLCFACKKDNSIAVFYKKGKTQYIRLKLETYLDLNSLIKMVANYTITNGYAQLPEIAAYSNIPTKAFETVDEELLKKIGDKNIIVLERDICKVRKAKLGDFVFKAIVFDWIEEDLEHIEVALSGRMLDKKNFSIYTETLIEEKVKQIPLMTPSKFYQDFILPIEFSFDVELAIPQSFLYFIQNKNTVLEKLKEDLKTGLETYINVPYSKEFSEQDERRIISQASSDFTSYFKFNFDTIESLYLNEEDLEEIEIIEEEEEKYDEFDIEGLDIDFDQVELNEEFDLEELGNIDLMDFSAPKNVITRTLDVPKKKKTKFIPNKMAINQLRINKMMRSFFFENVCPKTLSFLSEKKRNITDFEKLLCFSIVRSSTFNQGSHLNTFDSSDTAPQYLKDVEENGMKEKYKNSKRILWVNVIHDSCLIKLHDYQFMFSEVNIESHIEKIKSYLKTDFFKSLLDSNKTASTIRDLENIVRKQQELIKSDIDELNFEI